MSNLPEQVTRPSREKVLPGSMTVLAGRDAYLAENGFTVEAYDAKWTPASFLGVPVPVLNTRSHRRAIMLHDLHHVATGYGTDLSGEGEISAWEVRRGLSGAGLYVSAIVLSVFGWGLVSAPKRTVKAFRMGGGPACLFPTKRPYEELLAMTIAELRVELGVPDNGVSAGPRGLHDLAPAAP